MDTKHALKTKVGILEKKLAEKQQQLDVEPKSPTGESLKESIRSFISILLGMGVTYLYTRFPILGELQPDQMIIVSAFSAVIIRSLEKAWYQFQKNRGQVGEGTGFDLPFITLSHLFDRRKTAVVQIEESKK